MTIQHGEALASAPAPQAAAGFRDSGTLTRWLVMLLWANVVLAVIAGISILFQLKLLMDIQAGVTLAPGQAAASDLVQQVIAIVSLVQRVTLIVVFCVWIYRANYNARQLGAADMRFTPGWAVGWYFIPIMNLWKPYQAMREIWQASANPADWQHAQYGSILPLWWFLFLVSNIASNVSGRLSMQANTTPDLILATSALIVCDALDIAASVVALKVVQEIYRLQMSHRVSAAFT